jgi:hypothetical protein
MGNGFTFPLQTMIFTAILRACCHSHYGRIGYYPISCFGDDLVCPIEIYRKVIRCLRMMGFTPNPSKTFFECPFRESCGTDWFHGQPVRPIFVKKLDSPHDYMVALNLLNEWSAYTGIPLQGTIHMLFQCIPRQFRAMVPFDSSYDSGIRVPLTLVRPRYDRNLSFVFYSFEKRSVKITVGEQGIRAPRGFKGELLFNPPGLYASFLFGELVSFEIAIRHNRSLYRRKLRVCPYWDYIPTGRVTNGVALSWRQWETAVAINLAKPLRN